MLPIINENEIYSNDNNNNNNDNNNNNIFGKVISEPSTSPESEGSLEMNNNYVSIYNKFIEIENVNIIVYFREYTYTHNLNNNSKYIEKNYNTLLKTNTSNIKQKYIDNLSKNKENNQDIGLNYNECGKLVLSVYEIAIWCMAEINANNTLRIYLDINNIDMFIPCITSTWNIENTDKITIIGNYHHNKKLHDLIFNANKKNIEKLINDIIVYDEYYMLYASYILYPKSIKTKKLQMENLSDYDMYVEIEDIEDAENADDDIDYRLL